MAYHTPEGAAGTTAPRFRVFDPLRAEWATPYPATQPMTSNVAAGAVFDSEAAAVMHSQQLIGPARPWLVMQPVCPTSEGIN